MDATIEPRRDLLARAIQRWGNVAQVLMVVEEVGELLDALGKFSRGRLNRAEVITEIADVRIMLAQLEVLCEIDENEVEIEIDRKLKRLAERLAKAAA